MLDLNIGYRHVVMYLKCTYVCGVYSSMYAVQVISLWVVVNDALSVSLSHHMTVPFKQ